METKERKTGKTDETSISQLSVNRRAPALVDAPDPEVSEKKSRRRFTVQYKLRILEEADACSKPGEIGTLLRREGLYSSNLTTWRNQRREGILQAFSQRKRGRKPKEKNPLSRCLAELEKENEQLKSRLRKAEIIIDVQKKISEMLEIPENNNERNKL